jgi:hypothetical protein
VPDDRDVADLLLLRLSSAALLTIIGDALSGLSSLSGVCGSGIASGIVSENAVGGLMTPTDSSEISPVVRGLRTDGGLPEESDVADLLLLCCLALGNVGLIGRSAGGLEGILMLPIVGDWALDGILTVPMGDWALDGILTVPIVGDCGRAGNGLPERG